MQCMLIKWHDLAVVSLQEQLRNAAGEQVYQPTDFALLLKGFPPNATDEDEIRSFVCTSLLENQPSESVVKVVIGFDTRHYAEHLQLHECLRERLDILKVWLTRINVAL